MSSKTQVREILEYLGYRYFREKKNTSFGNITFRCMVHESGIPKGQNSVLELSANHETVWAILHGLSSKLPDFIDHVYPFPSNPKECIDTIYKSFKENYNAMD